MRAGIRSVRQTPPMGKRLRRKLNEDVLWLKQPNPYGGARLGPGPECDQSAYLLVEGELRRQAPYSQEASGRRGKVSRPPDHLIITFSYHRAVSVRG